MVELKTRDINLSGFGASDHRYVLQPCLTEHQLCRFEQKHRVTLPDDFREFLLRIGGSGAGPAYGLLPMTYWFSHTHLANGPYSLNVAFPYKEYWNPVDLVDYQENPEQYWHVSDECDRNEHINGTIAICHLGCGHLVLLVVTGSERGYLWTDFRGSDKGLSPSFTSDGTKGVTFLKWYD